MHKIMIGFCLGSAWPDTEPAHWSIDADLALVCYTWPRDSQPRIKQFLLAGVLPNLPQSVLSISARCIYGDKRYITLPDSRVLAMDAYTLSKGQFKSNCALSRVAGATAGLLKCTPGIGWSDIATVVTDIVMQTHIAPVCVLAGIYYASELYKLSGFALSDADYEVSCETACKTLAEFAPNTAAEMSMARGEIAEAIAAGLKAMSLTRLDLGTVGKQNHVLRTVSLIAYTHNMIIRAKASGQTISLKNIFNLVAQQHGDIDTNCAIAGSLCAIGQQDLVTHLLRLEFREWLERAIAGEEMIATPEFGIQPREDEEEPEPVET